MTPEERDNVIAAEMKAIGWDVICHIPPGVRDHNNYWKVARAVAAALAEGGVDVEAELAATSRQAESHATINDQAEAYRTCMRIAESLGATPGDLSGWLHSQASTIAALKFDNAAMTLDRDNQRSSLHTLQDELADLKNGLVGKVVITRGEAKALLDCREDRSWESEHEARSAFDSIRRQLSAPSTPSASEPADGVHCACGEPDCDGGADPQDDGLDEALIVLHAWACNAPVGHGAWQQRIVDALKALRSRLEATDGRLDTLAARLPSQNGGR